MYEKNIFILKQLKNLYNYYSNNFNVKAFVGQKFGLGDFNRN